MSAAALGKLVEVTGNKIGRDLNLNLEVNIVEQSVVKQAPAGLQLVRENVRQFWIESFLEDSIDDHLQLEVDKITQSKAVAHPWGKVVRVPRQTPQLLASGRSMESVFKDAGRALLILGQAGSGKTISLLELARDLMERGDDDDGEPVPVVFNLSTWTSGTQLSDWLLEEMKAKYFVPANAGRALLEGHFVVLLLDGLDEVRAENRAACVEAINDFVRENGVRGIAVCCRLEEYNALPMQLTLRGAVSLQPLSPDQVDEYLSRADPGLQVLRVLLQTDSQLQELAKTPLMLNVMSVAYKGLTPEALSAADLDTVEERRHHLFTKYVEEMFDRRLTAAAAYSRDRLLQGVSWLARQMRAHAESVFLIERLQPDWLRTRAERRVYIMTSRLLCGAALGLVLGAILDVTLGLTTANPGEPAEEAWELLIHLGVGLLFGSANGIVVGLMDVLRFERHQRRTEAPDEGVPPQVVMEVAGQVPVLVLLNWALISIVYGSDALVTGLMSGVLIGLLFGLFFGVHGSRRAMSNDIRTVEALHWSWTGLRRAAKGGLLGGTVVGVILGITVRLVGNPVGQDPSAAAWLIAGLLTGLLGAVVGSVVGAAFGSLESRIITRRTTPNQGIQLSARNALLAGTATGPMVALLLGVGGGAAQFLSAAQAANTALVGGLFFGMLAGLRAGGFDVIQHYTLRVVLTVRGYIPLDYGRFLDCAASLVFLQKAGGGYLFVHRLLLEHFAHYEGGGEAVTGMGGLDGGRNGLHLPDTLPNPRSGAAHAVD